MIFGDEQAYRRVVRIVSPFDYSDAYARLVFAGARLAAAERPAREAKEQFEDSWATAEKELDAIQWRIEGKYATPINMPRMNTGTQGDITYEQVDGGWIVVVADPAAAALPEDLRHMAKGWSARASAIDHATENLKAGKPAPNLQQYLEEETLRIRATLP